MEEISLRWGFLPTATQLYNVGLNIALEYARKGTNLTDDSRVDKFRESELGEDFRFTEKYKEWIDIPSTGKLLQELEDYLTIHKNQCLEDFDKLLRENYSSLKVWVRENSKDKRGLVSVYKQLMWKQKFV